MKSGNAFESTMFCWHDRVLLKVIPPLVALLVKGLMLSCRLIRIEGEKGKSIAESGAGLVYAVWHQRITYLLCFFGARHATLMTSQSRDGEYGATTMKWLGLKSVRGSSSRKGFRALKEMIQRIKTGETGAMVVDGPVGPARIAKKGSVIIARDAGVPLVPISWGADRCWTLNSWDRHLIPKPFARVVLRYGDPVWVPVSAKGEELDVYCRLLEKRLNQATGWCDRQFGNERPWRKVKEKYIPEVESPESMRGTEDV